MQGKNWRNWRNLCQVYIYIYREREREYVKVNLRRAIVREKIGEIGGFFVRLL